MVGCDAAAVILDPKPQLGIVAFEPQRHAPRARMAQHVRHRFLRDAEAGELDVARRAAVERRDVEIERRVVATRLPLPHPPRTMGWT